MTIVFHLRYLLAVAAAVPMVVSYAVLGHMARDVMRVVRAIGRYCWPAAVMLHSILYPLLITCVVVPPALRRFVAWLDPADLDLGGRTKAERYRLQ